ncbi:GM23417 [Drosophila sechellia]|uniref:GM23417 n=1 Tax=Drosophila sechellia TaxID=7238 RepID=B4INQ1_DROSE|nr:GM23417 [Drosophila sechellia]
MSSFGCLLWSLLGGRALDSALSRRLLWRSSLSRYRLESMFIAWKTVVSLRCCSAAVDVETLAPTASMTATSQKTIDFISVLAQRAGAKSPSGSPHRQAPCLLVE